MIYAVSNETGAKSRHGHMCGMDYGRGRGMIHMSRIPLRFVPRIGTQISVLPFGYMSFWFVGIPYYYYDGTY